MVDTLLTITIGDLTNSTGTTYRRPTTSYEVTGVASVIVSDIGGTGTLDCIVMPTGRKLINVNDIRPKSIKGVFFRTGKNLRSVIIANQGTR